MDKTPEWTDWSTKKPLANLPYKVKASGGATITSALATSFAASCIYLSRGRHRDE